MLIRSMNNITLAEIFGDYSGVCSCRIFLEIIQHFEFLFGYQITAQIIKKNKDDKEKTSWFSYIQ